ncbi:hypothetical protein Neosp_012933 [[Neocosmospora] mangrovei]
MSDLAGWWFIFKLLIPGMQERDLESLKMEYSPYYVHRAPAIMLPAMNFPASILDSVPNHDISVSTNVFPNPLNQMVLGTDANAATGDLERAEAVLEEVLGSADLSQDAFDNLSQVSDILMEMKRRLG